MGAGGLMQVVLDTNVLLAALIAPRGAPDLIFRAWRSGRFELVTSDTQLDELRRASRYPKLRSILPAHRVGTMMNNLQQAVVLNTLPALPDDIVLADANDEFVLAMALPSDADYLVTGDKRSGLLALGKLGRTRLVTPTAFCSAVLSRPG